jgi:hypothetical protein
MFAAMPESERLQFIKDKAGPLVQEPATPNPQDEERPPPPRLTTSVPAPAPAPAPAPLPPAPAPASLPAPEPEPEPEAEPEPVVPPAPAPAPAPLALPASAPAPAPATAVVVEARRPIPKPAALPPPVPAPKPVALPPPAPARAPAPASPPPPSPNAERTASMDVEAEPQLGPNGQPVVRPIPRKPSVPGKEKDPRLQGTVGVINRLVNKDSPITAKFQQGVCFKFRRNPQQLTKDSHHPPVLFHRESCHDAIIGSELGIPAGDRLRLCRPRTPHAGKPHEPRHGLHGGSNGGR